MDEVEETRAYLASTGLTEDQITRFFADGASAATLTNARLFGTAPRVPMETALADAGLDRDGAAAAMSALGIDPDAADLAPGMARVLAIFATARTMFGDEASARFGRVVNAAMSRVAESAVSMFGLEVEDPLAERSASMLEQAKAADQALAALALVPELFEALFHQQVVDAVVRLGAAHGDDATHETVTMSVGFADLVGSTAWSRGLTPRETAEALGELERLALQALTPGSRVVKTIGDEVMFAATTPAGAAAIARALLASVAASPLLPQVRIGVAHGRVVAVDGDLHGPVVSLAARLTSAAEPGTALLDPLAAQGVPGTTALAARPLAGFDEPVVPYQLD